MKGVVPNECMVRRVLRSWGALLFLALGWPAVHAQAESTQTTASTTAEASPPVENAQRRIDAAKKRVAGVYGKSIALVIGIDQYQHMRPLTGATRDAQAMAKVLREQGFEVTLLLNGEATGKGIKRLVTSGAADEMTETDRVFIYFAGHGVSVGDKESAMGYLMPVEAQEDLAAAEGIDMEWLQRIFRRMYKAKHVMFVADACYSGLAISTRGSARKADTPSAVSRLAKKRVRLSFTAGAAGQEAHEVGGHGLFTYALLKGLRGAADAGNPDGVVTSAELWSYVQTEVTGTASRKGFEQTPQFGREGEGEMLFANLSGEVRALGPGLTATTGTLGRQGPIMMWSALGLSVIAGALGTWAIVDGQAKWDEAESRFAAWDQTTNTSPVNIERDRAEVEALNADGTERTNVGRILLGVSGGLLLTSAVFFFLDGDDDGGGTAWRMGIDPRPHGTGIVFGGTW